jgi:hypothetical protein
MGRSERIALAAGLALILGGLACIYWPVALVAAGALLVALAVVE